MPQPPANVRVPVPPPDAPPGTAPVPTADPDDFTASGVAPSDRLADFLVSRAPLNTWPAELRHFIANWERHARRRLSPGEGPHAADYQAYQVLELPLFLRSAHDAVMQERERLRRKVAHCRERATPGAGSLRRQAASNAVQELARQEELLLSLETYLQPALQACLPLVAETLFQLQEMDLADCVATVAARIEERLSTGHPRERAACAGICAMVSDLIGPISLRVGQPPRLPPEPVEDPAASARALACGQVSPPLHFDTLHWVVEAMDLLCGFCLQLSVECEAVWAGEAMDRIEKALAALCEHEAGLAGREEPPGVRTAIARERRAMRTLQAERIGPPTAHTERETQLLFVRWANLVDTLVGWLDERGIDDPAERKPVQAAAVAEPLPDARSGANRRRKNKARPKPEPLPGAVPGEAPHTAPPATPFSSAGRRRAPRPSPPAAPAPPALHTLRAAAALPRLQDAARADPAEAAAVLQDFLYRRKLRTLLLAEPAPVAAALLDAMAALVERCAGGTPPLGFIALREMLDAAWVRSDTAPGTRLAAAVFEHFAARGPDDGKAAGFRLFCMGKGLERFLQALPAVPPDLARRALRALEGRLAALNRENEAARQAGHPAPADEFRQAVQQARLDYMSAYRKLSETERQQSADDMAAWLASALRAVAPHAGHAPVPSLARQLARLAGEPWPDGGQASDPESMLQTALRLLTEGRPASCRLLPEQRRAEINAHNLSTPVFEDLLKHLARRRTAAGAPAFNAFELSVGGVHHQDGGRAGDRKRQAVSQLAAEWGWPVQHDGGSILYLHDGSRPRTGWASYQAGFAS
ncbi:hypothetical protein GT347_04750 [Xylophilus rhododendri]|uniref:Uncharacterized protein n=1 Tax=Xylophilus rhododendri TaxID=2697032 RepID=A0A857J0G0_9BURK|nr:hypothetical protein [Xylophilus rhododendri]QHI97350.1 hypothetical protein GT347_04750 [Xylophilus rhododendri]